MNKVNVLVALCATLIFPKIAFAHLVTTGLGPVYDGIGHLLLTPEDIVAVLGICFLAGLQGKKHSRIVLFTLPLIWMLAGRVLGFHFDGLGDFPFAAVSFIVLGLLVASDLSVNAIGIAVLACGLGIVHGCDNGVALRENAGVHGLIGIMAAMFIVISLTTASVVSLSKPWMRIVVRVAGSWIVATGILMLGWYFRPAAENFQTERSGGDRSVQRSISERDLFGSNALQIVGRIQSTVASNGIQHEHQVSFTGEQHVFEETACNSGGPSFSGCFVSLPGSGRRHAVG